MATETGMAAMVLAAARVSSSSLSAGTTRDTRPMRSASAASMVRAVNSKAMDLLLTARTIDAAEAERIGLVSRVVPADKLLEETLAAARTIAAMPVSVAMMIKDCVNRAFETTLTDGVAYERRLFQAAFGTPAQKEGMHAFLEKRLPNFDGL